MLVKTYSEIVIRPVGNGLIVEPLPKMLENNMTPRPEGILVFTRIGDFNSWFNAYVIDDKEAK